MPRISDELRAQRRHHILTSAWTCFARDGFHATSMDDVISATGMSSSAVYRYFRSKDELIDATADEALGMTRAVFGRLLATQPAPTPRQTLVALVDGLRVRASHPDYDLSRIILQLWTESIRRQPLRERAQRVYREVLDNLTQLAVRWRDAGQIPPDADPSAVATLFFTLMPGLVLADQLLTGVSADHLARGIAALGTAT